MDEFIMETHKYKYNKDLTNFEDDTVKVVAAIVALELFFILCFICFNCCPYRNRRYRY